MVARPVRYGPVRQKTNSSNSVLPGAAGRSRLHRAPGRALQTGRILLAHLRRHPVLSKPLLELPVELAARRRPERPARCKPLWGSPMSSKCANTLSARRTTTVPWRHTMEGAPFHLGFWGLGSSPKSFQNRALHDLPEKNRALIECLCFHIRNASTFSRASCA